jgi:hypothetical protein
LVLVLVPVVVPAEFYSMFRTVEYSGTQTKSATWIESWTVPTVRQSGLHKRKADEEVDSKKFGRDIDSEYVIRNLSWVQTDVTVTAVSVGTV